MPFLTPLALLGLLFLPLIVAMYLLKLRRDEVVVPSTLLWQRLVADVEANAPWQRLRRSLLLLLQLLLVIALALLAARPFLERPAGLARDLVLVVDASASMAATDVLPSRLEVAKRTAIDALGDLPAGGKVSVIAAERTARVVANGTADLGRVRQAIEAIEPTASTGDLDDALRLAAALAARSGDAEVLVATDAALADTPTSRVGAPVRVLQVGRERKNQAIVALSVRPDPSSLRQSVFVSVANLDLEPVTRRVEVWGDGLLLEARDQFLDPQARSDIVIDDLAVDVGFLEVRLTGGDAGPEGHGDQLASDDRAWAIVPETRQREILLVSDGDPYLETALSYLPNSALFGLAPSEYPAGAARTDGREWDLVIFQGTLPAQLPRTAVLAIDPPTDSPLGDVTGRLIEPLLGSLDPNEPVLRYVDLSTLHIAEARRLVLPDWARTIIPGPGGSPLLYSGVRDGVPAAVLAFDPRRSDLPLQVAFPVLLANLTGELFGGSGAPVEPVRPGDPIQLALPAGATGLLVTRPDGSSVEVVPGVVGGGAVTFSQTDLPGIYAVDAILDPAASPSPSASPVASPAASPGSTPAAAPAASGAPATAPGDPSPTPAPDPLATIRFAVVLFDVDESNIAPGQPSVIERLGGAAAEPSAAPTDGASPVPTGEPGASPSAVPGAAGVDDRPPARDELWVPIVLLILLILLVEWAVYQRDAVARLRRGLAARFGRPAAPAAGAPGAGAGAPPAGEG